MSKKKPPPQPTDDDDLLYPLKSESPKKSSFAQAKEIFASPSGPETSIQHQVAFDQFDRISVDPKTLFVKDGQDEDFSEFWLYQLASYGILLTTRQALAEARKTRHDPAKGKSIQFHIKTAETPPYKGHLPIPEDWELISSTPVEGKPGLFHAEYEHDNGVHEKVYVTYERQDLEFIRKQIEAGIYKPIKCEPTTSIILQQGVSKKVISGALLEFEVKGGHRFSININEDELQPQPESMVALVEDLTKLWEARSAELETARSARSVKSPKIKPKQTETEKNIAAFFGSDFFKSHANETAKILQYAEIKDEKGNIISYGELKRNAHIACDEDCIPIKGDVDQRNNIYPDDMPFMVFDLIDIDPNDPMLVENLMHSLKVLEVVLRSNANHKKDKYIDIIAQAHKNLSKHIYINGDETKPRAFPSLAARNEIITLRGNENLLNAAFVIGLGTGVIQHGPDAISPLFPEDYKSNRIPIPGREKREGAEVIETYGEFDYLKCLLMEEAILKDKNIDLNPCAFVKVLPDLKMPIDPKNPNKKVQESRLDVKIETRDSKGNKREYNNYENEDASIEMTKLIFERQLLRYKQKYPEKFDEFCARTLAQDQKMRDRAAAAGNKPLRDQMEAGIQEKKAIVNSVKECKTADIPVRLQEIWEITNVSKPESKPNPQAETSLPESKPNLQAETSPPGSPRSRSTSPTPSIESTDSFRSKKSSHAFTPLKRSKSSLGRHEISRENCDKDIKINLKKSAARRMATHKGMKPSDYRRV